MTGIALHAIITVLTASEYHDVMMSPEDQIVAALRRIMRAVELHSRRLLDDYGLTGPQLATLREAARLGRPSVSALARAIHLSQPTVTGIVARLEKRGLVKRCRDNVDRRSIHVDVTVGGHEILNRTPPFLQDRFCRALAKLSDWEQSQMLATLQRIAEMMEADTLDASPVLVAGPVNANSETVETTENGPSPAPATELYGRAGDGEHVVSEGRNES